MQRYYGIEQPMKLTWRRFKALLFNLPAESAFLHAVRADSEAPSDASSVLDFLDAKMGRTPVQQTRRRTLEGMR